VEEPKEEVKEETKEEPAKEPIKETKVLSFISQFKKSKEEKIEEPKVEETKEEVEVDTKEIAKTLPFIAQFKKQREEKLEPKKKSKFGYISKPVEPEVELIEPIKYQLKKSEEVQESVPLIVDNEKVIQTEGDIKVQKFVKTNIDEVAVEEEIIVKEGIENKVIEDDEPNEKETSELELTLRKNNIENLEKIKKVTVDNKPIQRTNTIKTIDSKEIKEEISKEIGKEFKREISKLKSEIAKLKTQNNLKQTQNNLKQSKVQKKLELDINKLKKDLLKKSKVVTKPKVAKDVVPKKSETINVKPKRKFKGQSIKPVSKETLAKNKKMRMASDVVQNTFEINRKSIELKEIKKPENRSPLADFSSHEKDLLTTDISNDFMKVIREEKTNDNDQLVETKAFPSFNFDLAKEIRIAKNEVREDSIIKKVDKRPISIEEPNYLMRIKEIAQTLEIKIDKKNNEENINQRK
jgi:hypothetical protein